MRRIGGAVLIVALIASPVAAQLAGLTLAEALERLQQRGLPIVYSSSLVRPEMRVEREPSSTDARRILDEILAPHGLRAREGPAGQLVVVPAPRTDDVREAPAPIATFLEEVVVTPSHLRLLQEDPESGQFLSREEVDRMPHLADDVYWAVKRLPGASAEDLSAEFRVRGGDSDELLVVVDGVELYEPFHLKDFLKVFSIVDSSAIGGLDLLTGGFPVEYGGRLSGVMDISTRIPAGDSHTVSVGLIDSGILSTGTTGDGRAQWLFAARGWYPDAVLGASREIASEFGTDYYDLFGKFTRRVGHGSTLSAGVLAAYDDLGFRNEDPDEVEHVDAEYASVHSWVNFESALRPNLATRTVFSAGDMTRERNGGVADEEEGSLAISDRREFRFAALKQDWTLDLRDRHLLKWGFDVKGQRASYDYSRVHPEATIGVDYDRSGESYAAYVADRLRIGEAIVAEIGLRWDKQFWINDQQIAPRIHVRYARGSRTVFRAAWGRYHQWEQLNELQVEDGARDFYPAQRAEHWLLSVEHSLPHGIGVRVEAYHKELSEPRPRFENLFTPIELFPEAESDRVLVDPDKGHANGVELLVKNDPSRELTWWAGYALSEAIDEIGGKEVPRSWDQRHALTFSINRRFARGWNVNLAGTYHTGWPTTAMIAGGDGELILGARNRARLPAYHRLDARASKRFTTRAGAMTFVAEVMNLTGRANVCCVDDFVVVDGKAVPEYRFWPRVIPSFALRWEF